MTRVDEFDSFYRSTSASTLGVVYAACGDRAVAVEATVDAYRRAWRDWSKIRERHPLEYVRGEAHKLVVLARSTRPLRRRHESDRDPVLMDALASLPTDERRLVVLMTLGHADLEAASREIGVSAEEGIEGVTNAITALERELGEKIGVLEARIERLAEDTRGLTLPPANVVRRRAVQGRRRNTVVLVVAALAVIVGGGVAVADGDALAVHDELPYREKLGAERPDSILDAAKIDTDDLLTSRQVARLDPEANWSVTGTDTESSNDMPYATCPTQRFATKDPLRVFVRTHEVAGDTHERVAQSVEVTSSEKAAASAQKTLVQWFADCTHPRVQLVQAYTVEREGADFQILRLVSHRSPARTFTVGFSRTGNLANTLVHEVEGERVPTVEEFAATLNASVRRLCADTGETPCADAVEVRETDPPRTSEAAEFLGIVDLPPVAEIDQVWAGVTTRDSTANPAATLCDAAAFDRKDVESVGARVFVIPGVDELPETFGVAQTVALFSSEKAAKSFVDGAAGRIADCPDDTLSAEIDEAKRFSADDLYDGRTWRIRFELENGQRVAYRTAFIRRGNAVSQVTFTPSGDYSVSSGTFVALAERAAQRLVYLK